MKNQTVFQRYEIKYQLDRRQQQAILAAMAPYMEPDEYSHSSIRNLYLDTPDFRLIRRSLERPVYKEKLRVRSYRRAGLEEPVFVELKKKYGSVSISAVSPCPNGRPWTVSREAHPGRTPRSAGSWPMRRDFTPPCARQSFSPMSGTPTGEWRTRLSGSPLILRSATARRRLP